MSGRTIKKGGWLGFGWCVRPPVGRRRACVDRSDFKPFFERKKQNAAVGAAVPPPVGRHRAGADQSGFKPFLERKNKTLKLGLRCRLPLVGTGHVRTGQVSNRSLKEKNKTLQLEVAVPTSRGLHCERTNQGNGKGVGFHSHPQYSTQEPRRTVAYCVRKLVLTMGSTLDSPLC